MVISEFVVGMLLAVRTLPGLYLMRCIRVLPRRKITPRKPPRFYSSASC